MTVTIIGAGMAGLLAANMLHHRDPLILEQQEALPNNHSAVLRFRTPIVGDVLNIPFQKVKMIKAPIAWRNPVADALAYSFKNGGKFRSDRSITSGLVAEDRWIAPPDLIARMAARVKINYGNYFKFSQVPNAADGQNPIISTLPMPTLMTQLGYQNVQGHVKFDHIPGVNIRVRITDCDAYVSLLVPDPELPYSRISITGNEMIIEMPNGSVVSQSMKEFIVSSACGLLGIPASQVEEITFHVQRYAKINPIDDTVRRNFMHWATDNFNIFSLGRYATWRPGLLLDDLVQDIRKIDRWMSAGKYAIAKDR